jgi:hypothetical protein
MMSDNKRNNTRARLPDRQLDFFENTIALAVDAIQQLQPAVVRSTMDDLDLILKAIDSVLKLRRLTIREMNLQKELAEEARRNGDSTTTVTVLGKLADVRAYVDKPGYNVLASRPDWTPGMNVAFIEEAVKRGDQFLLVSSDVSGQYRIELELLFEKLQIAELERVTA